jgi:Mg2+-importing ATPase
MPWDNVDKEFLLIPRNWDASKIGKFMLWLGPTSSVFDIVTYLVMFFWIAPAVAGGAWATLSTSAKAVFMAVFHAGWFVESLWTQTLVIHMLRSPKIPFLQTRASWQVTALTSLGIAVGTILPFTPLGHAIGLNSLPWYFFPVLFAIVAAYMVLVTIFKKIYVKRYGELL